MGDSTAGRLAGRVVLVTGGASGIGAATVRRVAADGAVAISADITDLPTPLEGATEHHRLDVTDEAAVAALVAGVVERHGRIDGVVTAAGVAGAGAVHELDAAEWHRVIGVNLTGTFLTAKHALAAMIGQEPDAIGQRGAIVTLASIEGI